MSGIGDLTPVVDVTQAVWSCGDFDILLRKARGIENRIVGNTNFYTDTTEAFDSHYFGKDDFEEINSKTYT